MNKSWLVIESFSGLCNGIKKDNCQLCGICQIENGILKEEDDE